MADLQEASKQKQVSEHGVIDDAVRDQGKDYNVFSVPVGHLFYNSLQLGRNTVQTFQGQAEEHCCKGLHGKSGKFTSTPPTDDRSSSQLRTPTTPIQPLAGSLGCNEDRHLPERHSTRATHLEDPLR